MNFIEAHNTLKDFKSDKTVSFLLALSGMSDNLDIFLRAHAAKRGYLCDYETLPFNTLQQTIFGSTHNKNEVFVLMPWDFLPELDWRSGIPGAKIDFDTALQSISNICEKLQLRKQARFIYINAPTPPIFINDNHNKTISLQLIETSRQLRASILDESFFTLSGYLNQGHPFPGTLAGQLAEEIIATVLNKERINYKLLITDLDNVLWHGVIGEDGVEHIQYRNEGLGYGHFIYQSYLKKLKDQGILLAAVSRNDTELALQAFKQGNMLLEQDDFISIIASYEAKSSQIKTLAHSLNLSPDSFVFVDDNPIEIEEVSTALPEVHCLLFPSKTHLLPELLSKLSGLFSREVLTIEDLNKTKLYKKRLKGVAPSTIEGADLYGFLIQLNMRLLIQAKTSDNNLRAVQLINKTNQFNLNGLRLDKDQVDNILQNGGQLFCAELNDKHGSHGEVLACLINRDLKIEALVMSCRIFQRNAEYAFLNWLITKLKTSELIFKYLETERNIPMQKFLSSDCFDHSNPKNIILKCDQFLKQYAQKSDLFSVDQN